MNKVFTNVAVLLSLACGGVAMGQATTQPSAQGGAQVAGARTADEILKDWDAVVMPTMDKDKVQDKAWVEQYRKEMMEGLAKKAVLAKELWVVAPENERLGKILTVRFKYLMQTNDKSLIEEVDQVLKTGKPKEMVPSLTSLKGQLLFQDAMSKEGAEQVAALKQVAKDYAGTPVEGMATGELKKVERIGQVFEIKFKDAITGKEVSTETLKGKVVVVDFWATWCGPCVAEMPKMKALYAEYKDKGVEFVGVSLDQPEDKGGLTKLKEYVAKNEIGWPQYYQGNFWQSEFSMSWGINSIPALFVVDHEGKLVSTAGRGKLETLLPELIAKRDKRAVGMAN